MIKLEPSKGATIFMLVLKNVFVAHSYILNQKNLLLHGFIFIVISLILAESFGPRLYGGRLYGGGLYGGTLPNCEISYGLWPLINFMYFYFLLIKTII